MKRAFNSLTDFFANRDYFGIGLLALIVGVIVCSVSILFSSTMRDMAMQRFHLGSSNFPQWAAHQTVPSMYNFENRIQFTNDLLGEAPFSSTNTNYRKRTLNHFPARYLTFGNNHLHCFSEKREGTLELSSVFGDTHLITRLEITEKEEALDKRHSSSSPIPMIIRRVSQRWEKTSGGSVDE